VKLKTEMSHSNSWHAPRAVGSFIEEDDEREQFRHDAAVAHALKQSIERLNPIYRECIYNEASEIMRSWGFERDKVTP
jgi:hypothetical protein